MKQKIVNTILDKAREELAHKIKFNYHGYSVQPPGPNSSKTPEEAKQSIVEE